MLGDKKKDIWLLKSFRKMPFHLGKIKGQANEVVGDQKQQDDDFSNADQANTRNAEIGSLAEGGIPGAQTVSGVVQTDDEPQAEY